MKVRHEFPRELHLQTDHLVILPRRSRRASVGAGRVRAMLGTGAVLAAIWAGLHWNDPGSWVIGLPTVIAGAAATSLLPAAPPPAISLFGALRLAWFAFAGVLRGARDVSLFSLAPGRLRSGCLTVRTRLPEGRPRRLFALLITLLPGTLTARLEDDRLTVHALDCGPATRADLDALETRIAGLFRLSLDGDVS
ncbi:Na+/H+ antiporter subunit E [Tropicimonas sp. IMCC6043]|uniref:Na+/H+ antiporter subunit E n=1 Tax=Tropicimonas sp. IMCC6043 TaxID=2510645 RepID=UPI00101DDAC2|nr:Na+/H+ antiporter subunit E [Tropicimonas sp. IMCC6043]RYH07078.1 cation transporter [Tropicimonas sp. IMCC6043]